MADTFRYPLSLALDRVFVHALNTVKKIPRAGTARPPTADRLRLYGLYKQSMEGNVDGVMDRPIGDGADVQAEQEKWDAWYSQRDLSRTEAKRRYISTLIETMHRYASGTPEALELISELEFVWDQIRNNISSSSSSSPLQPVGLPARDQRYSRYGNISDRISQSGSNEMGRRTERDSRLRVLSPISQPDDGMRRRDYQTGDLEDHEEVEAEEDEDEDDEEFQEARNTPYEDDESEHDDAKDPHLRPSDANINEPHRDKFNRKWRRRVEQALTKMTAEVAAMREQMEARAIYKRRARSLLAWLKWLAWVTIRQLFWDAIILCAALAWMRLKGDRRLEEKLIKGFIHLRKRMKIIRLLRSIPRMPLLP
ncbi:hypothetical protein AJ80_06818 [Polytolypa hystricis UAMH7299]|uniref:ACB domain-containing protein n=1 Tax=Polytolypa hystricis (strain UAMH7299) TaxID=1447883 RepID=A0A2B7XUC7_POLH7|nr:hypothetical protein AJ80_06818 [Polytolypa hystricis UAMH7299]